MHTTDHLRSSSFAIDLDGRPAGFADLFVGYDHRDRLGVVVREPCGALGASLMILAAATAFYDDRRTRELDGVAYPDHYVLHVGRPLGDHGMLDIWPAHKEVVVEEASEEALLRAINDRGITRLVIPAAEPAEPQLEAYTRASAEQRIVDAFLYSAHGALPDGDVRIAGDEQTEAWVRDVIEQSPLSATEREVATARRAPIAALARPVETYRRIPVERALQGLAPAA